MLRSSPISRVAESDPRELTSDDRSLSFVVSRSERGVLVERIQPLNGLGKVAHLMEFGDIESFARAYEVDPKRFTYPLLYWQLQRAVREHLEHGR
jgi:hypothetical protein